MRSCNTFTTSVSLSSIGGATASNTPLPRFRASEAILARSIFLRSSSRNLDCSACASSLACKSANRFSASARNWDCIVFAVFQRDPPHELQDAPPPYTFLLSCRSASGWSSDLSELVDELVNVCVSSLTLRLESELARAVSPLFLALSVCAFTLSLGLARAPLPGRTLGVSGLDVFSFENSARNSSIDASSVVVLGSFGSPGGCSGKSLRSASKSSAFML